jgi:hypothetical protein
MSYYDNLVIKGMIKEDDKEPDVGPYSFYLAAFNELGTCRQVGMGLGPIPFTSIVSYFNLYGEGILDFEDFLYIIRCMDSKFMSLVNKTPDKGKKVKPSARSKT